LSDGWPITRGLIRSVIAEKAKHVPGERIAEAARIFEQMTLDPDFTEFLTVVAYDYID
jgi:hypothetical protein